MMDALTHYVRSVINDPFEWGTHDCLTFATEAVRVFSGTGYGFFPVGVLSGYSTKSEASERYVEMQQMLGYDNVIDAIDARFDRLTTLYPPHGTLVARPVRAGPLNYAFGISINGNLALMTLDGIVKAAPDASDIYWEVA